MSAARSLAGHTPLGAYRRLLRAATATFRNDPTALTAAKGEIRNKFDDSKEETDGEKLKSLVSEAYDAADFIRQHVVQAALNEEGNYEIKVGQHHTQDSEPVKPQ
mmetsp:Transcript_1520/g.3334  ORF Transcript_1520/g.3334 Transcript_1520/m.3334 type:complete len:105 (-) Transcript_1520:89-403(-)|eukprot:CAMPEP_0198234282 /NCGR_PEP_ID=MMETSP1446-20131203/336_1 /TAXON_ID=1461542 ORGANISM="Unidentified sp, Strain CCMP2111" /NCGR_SAMPLE_ID=MMETSP1446 /ASSEMBLY_ACC=CAM_ASM_001112 /LENGTH=104 /DNA_ID=CAMNT_0043915033 /DNA_START=248 /DNA_END=562 /DNA_ORIENTATION=-